MESCSTQSFTHLGSTLDFLTKSSEASSLQKVTAPLLRWCDVGQVRWVDRNCRGRNGLGPHHIIVKGQSSTKRADGRDARCDKPMSNRKEMIPYLSVSLLALVIVVGIGSHKLKEHHRLVLVRDGESCSDLGGPTVQMRDVELRLDFEIAVEAEKVVEKSCVWPVIHRFIECVLGLIGHREGFGEGLR